MLDPGLQDGDCKVEETTNAVFLPELSVACLGGQSTSRVGSKGGKGPASGDEGRHGCKNER